MSYSSSSDKQGASSSSLSHSVTRVNTHHLSPDDAIDLVQGVLQFEVSITWGELEFEYQTVNLGRTNRRTLNGIVDEKL